MKKLLLNFLSAMLILNVIQVSAQSYRWAKALGGNLDDNGYHLAMDGSGNVYVLGYFQGTADFDPSAGTANLTAAGNSDVFIAKYDANGNYIWAKGLGGTDYEFGNSIALDAAGNVYITGIFRSTADFDPSGGTAALVSAGGDDIFIAKYDASGNYTWSKRIGSGGYDYSQGIAVDVNGNCYITGYFSGTVDFDPSAGTVNLSAIVNDAFVAKYSSAGNYVWAKDIGGTWDDYGQAITLDANSNVYITGRFNGTVNFGGSGSLQSSGGEDIFLAKYSSAGTYAWAINMGSSGATTGDGKGIKVDKSGNVYLTGFIYGIMDFDPSAGTADLTPAGAEDIFLAKYNSAGTYVWAINMGGKSPDYGLSLSLDGAGNPFITGFFSDTADFDPSSETIKLSSSGAWDIFLAKYNLDGICQWAKHVGGTGNEKGQAMVIDANTDIWLTGYFTGTCDFDPSSGTANLTAAGQVDVFLSKYCGNVPALPGTIQGNPSICSGNSYTYSVTKDSTATLYTWTLPNGWTGTSTTNSITVTPGTTGGTLSVAAQNSCGVSTARTLNITVTALDISVSRAPGQLTANATGAGYQWLDCSDAYAPISGATAKTFMPDANGHYAVAVTINGCTDTSICYNAFPVGIDEYVTGSVSIYPNPCDGHLFIDFGAAGEDVLVVVRNLWGQKILEQMYSSGDKSGIFIDAPDGMYVVTLTHKEGYITAGKVVVRR